MTEDRRPKFSICIPNYNYGRFISDTIRSVLDQSFEDFEIIVADNASTDDSIDVVQSFKDPRIRLVRNRYNIGFAPNLQRVTMEARGDFVNLLSSDDQMKPGALEAYAQIIGELSKDDTRLVLMSDAEGFDNNGRVLRLIRKVNVSFARESVPAGAAPNGPLYTVYKGREVLRDRLRHLDAVGVFCSITYARPLWEAIEGYNSVRTIGPDKHFGYKLLAQDPVVAYVHRPLFQYRDYVSDNRAATQTTIRQPIDDYLNILEFGTEEFLGPVGLTRRDLQNAFLHRVLRDALVQLGLRNAPLARRLVAFALATYPASAFRQKYLYVLLPLLAMGPLGEALAPTLRTLYRRAARRSDVLEVTNASR